MPRYTNEGLTAIRVSVDHTANLIAKQPTNQWAPWVTYLLEALDQAAALDATTRLGNISGQSDAYRQTLRSVRRDICTRLTSGGW